MSRSPRRSLGFRAIPSLWAIFLVAGVGLVAGNARADEAPVTSVDVEDHAQKTVLSDELSRGVPLLGRGFDALLPYATGAAPELDARGLAKGISLGGGTRYGNDFLVDGMSVRSPSLGLLGTPLSLEFLRRTEVTVAGAGVEYGRANGGVVEATTRSGSNELHGDAWFNYSPLQLDPAEVGRAGEAIAWKRRSVDHAFDFGADLGGALVKDRVWFFIGVAPTLLTQSYDRIPRSLSSPGSPTDGRATTDLPASNAIHYESQSQTFSLIGKLDFRLSDDATLSLEYLGAPGSFNGVYDDPRGASPVGPSPTSATGGFYGSPGALPFTSDHQAHDVIARYVQLLLKRRLRIEVRAGVHIESEKIRPAVGSAGEEAAIVDERGGSLTRYEALSPCAPQTLNGMPFNPCPVGAYLDGGLGLLHDTDEQRESAGVSFTYLAQLFGTHSLSLGLDLEREALTDHQFFTSAQSGLPAAQGGRYDVAGDGSVVRTQFASVGSDGTVSLLADGVTTSSVTLRESLYLRDTWNVSFIPGLTINAGARWEAWQLFGSDGSLAASIADNLAPRAGFSYDFTHRRRGKLYASYGRYYGDIPLEVSDRFLSGTLVSRQNAACGVDSAGRLLPSTCTFPSLTRADLAASGSATVAPGLKGPFQDEVLAGMEYEPGFGLVLGAAYIHRELGRSIEALGSDGKTLVLGNPGETDPSYEKPTRIYNALLVTAQKHLGHHLQILASYTFSQTTGTYDGSYPGSAAQSAIDPNAPPLPPSLDQKTLLLNRDGPLPDDRPHNFKLLASYLIPLERIGGGTDSGLTVAVAFVAMSGVPIDVLGSRASGDEVYILPRGSGGRTPTLTQLDLHLAYRRSVARDLRVELSADVFNVLNQQTATTVDNEYTADDVLPIEKGTTADLAHLKTTSGAPARINPNYGQPTSYQQPLSLRFGARVMF